MCVRRVFVSTTSTNREKVTVGCIVNNTIASSAFCQATGYVNPAPLITAAVTNGRSKPTLQDRIQKRCVTDQTGGVEYCKTAKNILKSVGVEQKVQCRPTKCGQLIAKALQASTTRGSTGLPLLVQTTFRGVLAEDSSGTAIFVDSVTLGQ